MDRLNKIELVPFKNAIKNDVVSVMIAHLSFPELEQSAHIPASLSSKIVQGLLIDQLGFKGLVVTDALNMKGITKYFSTEEVAVMCVNAGIDLILMPMDEEATIDAIEAAFNRGSISEERINRSAEKILKSKEWLGLFENKLVTSSEFIDAFQSDAAAKLSQKIADESITLVKDDLNVIPFKNLNNVLIVNLSDGKDNINSGYFSRRAEFYFKSVKTIDIFSDNISPENAGELSNAGSYDCVLVGIYAKVKYGTGKISIPTGQTEVINNLFAVNKNTAVISFGNPYLLREFPSIPNYICAYGDADVSITAALRAVTGYIKISGKLPVSINDDYRFGLGLSR
jgi:beta-N-acetylhexosaminidase